LKTNNNKRLAKNTIFLYVRMLLIMLVSLYTSRVVLKTLGAVDYGIYNVIGGVVTIFSFINATLALSSERFIAILIGKNAPIGEIRKNFSTILTIHFGIALLVAVLCETIGLAFLENQMNIPLERMNAALFVFHFSVISIFFSFLLVPYNGIIIAYERMNVFAYLSILDAVLKLVAVYLLGFLDFDKLSLYSFLILSIGIFSFFLYFIYCQKKIAGAKYIWNNNSSLYKEILSFSGWNIFSSLSSSLSNQGINILMNIFFGPVVNAARGIAFQVNGAIGGFTSNFQIAVNPQIFKLWGQHQVQEFKDLILSSSKYSFLLISVILCPILLEINIILKTWLENPPENTAVFCRLIVVQIIVYSLSRSYVTGVNAIGEIKKLNLFSGISLLSVLPLSYIFYNLGYPAYIAFIIYGLSLIIEFIIAFSILHHSANMTYSEFLTKTILPIFKVLIFALPIPIFIYFNLQESFLRLVLVGLSDVLFFLVGTYIFALDEQLKKEIISRIKRIKK